MLRRLGLWLGLAGLSAGQVSPVVSPHDALANADSGSAIITGSVHSTSGQALASVSVSLDSFGLETRSDSAGRYRLVVPASRVKGQKATLRAQLAGFKVETRKLTLKAGPLTMDFVMRPHAVMLSEIVAARPLNFAESRGSALPSANAMYDIAGDLKDADEVVVIDKSALASPAAPMPPSMGMARSERLGASYYAQPTRQAMAKEAGRFKSVSESSRPATVGERPTQGVLRARSATGDIVGEFPLRHTDVSAEISGSLARTLVEQRYTNPYDRAIEAVYVFPVPSLAAVNDFVMDVGGRKIVGLIRPRAEAERLYQAALARGQTASLLTQERPNIFTQSVANIAPHDSVTIRITYFERLSYDHGEYQYVFPMVVGPRYIPGNPQSPVQLAHDQHSPAPAAPDTDGGGWSPNTDIVPDASRITPPVLPPGMRSGHDISVTVKLDAAMPVKALDVATHDVAIDALSSSTRTIRLASHDAIANKDFVLRWSVAGKETQFGVLAHREGKDGYWRDGYLSLAMQPPLEPSDAQVTPREITFVMDVSGSMMGTPMRVSKSVVERTLDQLRPEDLFNIVYFASGNAQLWSDPQPRTAENVAAAKRFLERLEAGGGTEMLAGVHRALAAHHDGKYLQMYAFLTDGYVGDEDRILSLIEHERGDARFFGFGVGSAVNRYLIDGIGRVGGGQSFVIIPRDSTSADRAVDQLFAAIDSPVLVDVAVDWNGLPVVDAYPQRLPDLFAGQTINLVARYTKPASGTAYVTGRIGARRVRMPVRVNLPVAETAHEALAPTWARWKIADLSDALRNAAGTSDTSAIEQEITNVALAHRLVSQYTSFVAVDESRIVSDGRPVRVMQPVELPEGVSYQGIFGEQPVGLPMRIGSWGADVQGTSSGVVKVGALTAHGAAEQAGLRRGSTVRSVNGAAVTTVAQLEAMLLQSNRTVVLETDKGRVELRAP